jgi:phospholipid/cholesterol/gamma-HCH transport system substrate-binding protein
VNLKSAFTFVAFAAMIAAFVAFVANLGVRVSPPDNRVNLAMNVPTINNMELDARVLLRGVPVGKVTGLESTPENGTIHFYVDGQHKIPQDSDVRLENLSALGESYIEIEPRSVDGPYWQNGQRLTTESVKAPRSISELGASVTRVLNEMNPDELSRVTGEADAALPDVNAVLPNLANASLLLRNTVADFHGQGRQVLENLQTLLQNASWVGPALAESATTIGQLGRGLHGTANNAAHISLAAEQPTGTYVFGKLLQRLQKLLDDRGADIRVLTEPLMANVKQLAGAVGSIDTSQILSNLLETVPEDGAIELHVAGSGR